MQSNPAPTNIGILAWSSPTSRDIAIYNHVNFGFVFEVTADIVTDAVFNIEAAPGDDADPCVPGAYAPVPEIANCSSNAVPGPQAQVTIPAGTLAGSICYGTVPCRNNRFMRLTAESGDTANVIAVAVLQGPKR